MNIKHGKYLCRCFLCAMLSAAVLSGCGTAPGDTAGQGGSAQGTAEQGTGSSQLSDQEELKDQVIFEGIDIEGNEVSSDVFAQSKLTMVNVWATYCNPCLSEMPILGELASEYDAEDFQLIGIISDVQEKATQKELDKAANLIEQTNADYSHLLLNESVYYALLTEVVAVPTTFFIDEEGVVLDVVIGAMDKVTWKEKIDGLLDKQQEK